MIEIPRRLVQQLAAVLKTSVLAGLHRLDSVPVRFQAGPEGLRMQATQNEVAAAYDLPGSYGSGTIVLSSVALRDFVGRGDDLVVLEEREPNKVVARWHEEGVPQVREYATPENVPEFPPAPDTWTPLGTDLLTALSAAVPITSHDSTRFALRRLQLRGGKGEIVASDGRQLLIQKGFAFPWSEDLLVPALAVFGRRELPCDRLVEVGKTASHVGLRLGPWTFLLAIDADGRYPDAASVLPRTNGKLTTWSIAPSDAAFLARALPRLPGDDDAYSPVTLDLNGQAAVRARCEGQPQITEVVLGASTITGLPVRLVSNRAFLARALALGFPELSVVNADVPVVCRDGSRTYAWMPLGATGALAPQDDALRIEAPAETPSPSPTTPQRKKPAMTHSANGAGDRNSANGAAPEPADEASGTLLKEAEVLKDLLRDAHSRANRLIAALRKQRRQSQLLRGTLSALRQLQQIGA